jgi:hypothetical protein
MPSSALLDETLRVVARRYRLPEAVAASSQMEKTGPAARLAIAIEQARQALVRGDVPDPTLRRLFIEALACMLDEAMRLEGGDAAFQAMVLRHRAPQVDEYAALSAQANQDRRSVHAAVNAVAHPAKQQQILPGSRREALAQLHACASTASWSEVSDTARRLLDMPELANEPALERGLTRVLESAELKRLQRLDALASDELVRQYQALWERNGPRSGSATAVAEGSVSRKRGEAVEALAAQALEALARRLNEAEGACYRVVTSMRVPSSLPGNSQHAKTEWDAVLLRQAHANDATAVWDVCLLVEAKASVDAATTDFPRLRRGLRLLANAHKKVVYPFKTQQETVHLSGASLSALPTDETGLTRTVLYCVDAPAETTPRLLSAAGRMQLLSAPASLEFASALANKQKPDPQLLEPLWHQVLESPRWSAVLHQYCVLHQVRELMVHIDDLLIASGKVGRTSPSIMDASRSRQYIGNSDYESI